MADSDTEICNMALGHLGIDAEIGILSTERSAEARACRKYFTTVRDQCLRDFPYPFSKKLATLAEITNAEDDEDTHPTEEWDYQYAVPSDCLMPRKIQSGTRQDTRDSRVAFLEAYGDSGQVIFTDMDDAILEYTKRVDSAVRYPADFVMACSLRLAAVIAPQLTGGDPFKLGIQALQKYKIEISIAKANAANEEQPEETPDAEWIRARS
jgi:hypothetical protein